MTAANLSYDPLAAFAIRLPSPGYAGDYAAKARDEIERRFGTEVAEDFVSAYRDNDTDAAGRVAKKLAGNIEFSFTKEGADFVGKAVADQVKLVSKGNAANYRSEAHFLLQFALEIANTAELKLSREAEPVFTPPTPRPPELKKPKAF